MNYGKINTALWICWLLYWIASARGNKKTIQGSKPGLRLLALGLVFGFAVFLYRQHSARLDMRILPDTRQMQQLGTACCAAGILFSLWARRILGTNWSANPTIKENHELITSGPYEFVRHPIYTGILLALFGSLVLANGHLRDLIIYIFAAGLLWLKLKVEEGLMMKTFPDSYPDYKRRTKALIPFIL